MEDNKGNICYTIAGLLTAVIGHHIHGSIFWAIIDWMFWPIVWCKWLICQEVSLSVVKSAFEFFFK